MNRSEFAEMVGRLVASKQMTLPQAARLLHSFTIGDIALASLPLPLSELPGKLTKEDFKEVLRSAVVQLTPLDGQKLLATQNRTGASQPTPPEVKAYLRERLRNKFRGDFEGRMRKYAGALHAGGDVNGWHGAMIREQRSYIARQYTAGLGRALTQKEMDEVNQLSSIQNRYLHRFASQVSVRRLEGRPFSLKYLVARHFQYGGVGWGAWFRGNEIATARGDGYVIEYEAHDDDRTCGPCHDAEVNGPYLPGSKGIPYPGQVCRGHGLCRCKHRIVRDMDKWRELKGLSEKVRPKEDDPEEALDKEDVMAGRVAKTLLKAPVPPPPPSKPKPIPSKRLTMFSELDALLKDALASPERRLAMRQALRTKGVENADLDQVKAFITGKLSDNRLDARATKIHGMSESAEMVGTLIDGVEVRWEPGDKAEQNVMLTFANMYVEDVLGNQLPDQLWRANRGIYFTSQSSSYDDDLSLIHGRRFVSAATGGDGLIAVYNGKGMSLATLAHESAHNVANDLYGKVEPERITVKVDGFFEPVSTEWRNIVRSGEPAVSEYAETNIAEDFAESFAWYTTQRERLRVRQPKRFALIEKILAGEGEELIRKGRASGLTAEESDEAFRTARIAPRKDETEEERKARRKAEHARWKERKEAERLAAEADAARADAELVKAREDAAKAKYEVDRKAAEEAAKTITAIDSDSDATKAETHRLSRSLTHLRWKAKRTTGSALAEVEAEIRDKEALLKSLREPASDATARRKAEDDELARLASLSRAKEEEEAKKLAEEAERAAESARLARELALEEEKARAKAEEATRRAAEAEAERIRIIEEKKEKKRLTHLRWKEKKEAEKLAAKAAGVKVAKYARDPLTVRAEIAAIDAEVTRIRTKRTAGEADTPAEKAFMDTRRKELDLLWAEVKRSEEEDVALKALASAPTVPPPKAFKPVLTIEGEITRLEIRAIHLDRKMKAGEKLSIAEDTWLYDDKDKHLAAWRKELADSKAEDRKASASVPAPKKYRHVASLESELATIELEVSRLTRRRYRGESLTDAELEFLAKASDRADAIRDEKRLSEEEDKTRIAIESAIATRELSGKVTLSVRPPQKKIDEMADRVRHDLRLAGVDPDEALAAFKELIESFPAVINTKDNILGFWRVGEERFKTQFETGTSMGANDNAKRARAEAKGLGYSSNPDVARPLRPVYGFINIPGNSAAHYAGSGGGFAWKVKDSVRARMTVTMGDSLYPMGAESQMGTPMLDPGFEGIGSTFNQGALVRYVKSKRTDRDKEAFMSSISYIEWQCQDQLNLSDIESVVDNAGSMTPADVQWLADRGITVEKAKRRTRY